MTATIEEMQELVKIRYDFLSEVLQNTTEEQLNSQPLLSKRSIGEIMKHIMLVDGLPILGKKLFYNSINIFTRIVERANRKPADASDYKWKLNNDKGRKPKVVSKEKLEKSHSKSYKKLQNSLIKAKEKDRRVLHITERHANVHMKQIQVLMEKI